MIVPIITDFLTTHNADSLWFFYFCLSFAKKEKWPIIAPEYYFVNPSEWADKGRSEASAGEWPAYNLYDTPTQKDLDSIKQVHIPDALYNECAKQAGSYTDAAIIIHRERYDQLYDWVRKQLLSLQKIEPIEAILMLSHVPSIYDAAKDLGIDVIHTEWSPLRPPTYRRVAYLDFTDLVHDKSDCQKRWEKFSSISHNLPILSRKALLSFFLEPAYLPLISCLDWKPQHELGLVAYEPDHPILLRHGHMGNNDLIFLATQIYKTNDLLFRSRPWHAQGALAKGIKQDTSFSPAQFIASCKRVACVSSNMGFEAMLWGRTSYVFNPTPVRFMAKTDFSDTELSVVDTAFVNFYLLSYMIPYERLTDTKYLRWRLSRPSEEEIYLDNLNHYLKALGLNLEKILASPDFAAEVLLGRGRDENGFSLSEQYPGNIEAPFTENTDILKLSLCSDSVEKHSRLIGINDTSFSFAIACEKYSGKIEMIFEMPDGAIININATTHNNTNVTFTPLNALPDGISFARSNPSFEINFPEDTKIMLVSGTLQKRDASEMSLIWFWNSWLDEKGTANDLVVQNKNLVEQTNDLVVQNKNLVEQNNDLVVQNKNLVEQTNDLVVQTNDLVVQNKNLVEQTNDLVVQNKNLVEQNNDLVAQIKEYAKTDANYNLLIQRLHNHRIRSSAALLLGKKFNDNAST